MQNTCSGPLEREDLSVTGLGCCHINSGARVNIQAEDIAPKVSPAKLWGKEGQLQTLQLKKSWKEPQTFK